MSNQPDSRPAPAHPAPVCPEPSEAPWLWPWGMKRNEDGQLAIRGGVTLSELGQEFGTPTYIFDLDTFSQRAYTIATALAEEFWEGYGFNGASVYYAGKAFLCTALGPILHQAGLGLDTASLGELSCALNPASQMPVEEIGLHGNNKSVQSLRLALESGIGRIIVDSLAEIELLNKLAGELDKVAPVMVRVTTGVHAGGHEFIATAYEDQKFGLSLASGAAAKAVAAVIAAENLKLTGLHSHIGSQISDLDAFQEAAIRVMEFRAQMQKRHGCRIVEVDLGGGLAISYEGEAAPSANTYAKGLAEAVRQACDKAGTGIPHISIEPGRWLAGPSCVTIYRVGTIKDVRLEDGGFRRYVSVDGGMSDNIRPVLYGAGYRVTLANRASEAELVNCRIVGLHCESGDILVPAIGLPADLKAGDLLAMPATGAYGRSMASNYNWTPRPGVLGVSETWGAGIAGAKWIYAPETVADLLAADPFAR